MLETLRIVLACVGAGLILAALLFVTLLIGGLVNAMVLLMAGPIIDRFIKEEDPRAA